MLFATENHLDVIKRVWKSGDVVQLVESLLSMEEALDPPQDQIKGTWWGTYSPYSPYIEHSGTYSPCTWEMRPEEQKLKVSLGFLNMELRSAWDTLEKKLSLEFGGNEATLWHLEVSKL